MTDERKRRECVIALAVVLLVALGTAYLVYQQLEVVEDAYAAWWTADVIVAHLESHDGQWPRDWDELRKAYDAMKGNKRSFDDIRARCEVRFDVTSADILNHWRTTGDALQVVTILGGQDHHWKSREPNTIVLDYLRGKSH